MISHKHRCIFAEVPKTASTSIRTVIGQPPKPHLNLIQIRESYRESIKDQYGEEGSRRAADEVFRSYFKFGFVRNPWQRTVSLYNRREGMVLSKQMTFDEFARWIQLSSDTCLHPTPHRYQLDWFRDEHGEIVADFIGKFENLQADWAAIKARLGIDKDLPHANANPKNQRHYSEYYTPETRDLIAQKFSVDIEYFGYEFETVG